MSDPLETPELRELAEGVFLRQAVDNIAWVDLGGELLVIDTGEAAPGLAEDVLKMIDQTTGQPPAVTVVNTHTHYDHVGLNETFAARGARIVNAETHPMDDDGLELTGQRRKAWLFPTPGVHTDTDCCLLLQPDSILFVGDLFGWGLCPPNGPLTDTLARKIDATCQRLIDLHAQTVVPGHGPACTNAELIRWREYFHWLIETIGQHVAAGMRDADIIATVEPPADMQHWWRFVQWKHQNSVEKVLALLRTGWTGLP
jgi:glyoxylase-like metal-dependent hydrolase (beta-lactamase superfamily II)